LEFHALVEGDAATPGAPETTATLNATTSAAAARRSHPQSS
jgi:hypothetical protein